VLLFILTSSITSGIVILIDKKEFDNNASGGNKPFNDLVNKFPVHLFTISVKTFIFQAELGILLDVAVLYEDSPYPEYKLCSLTINNRYVDPNNIWIEYNEMEQSTANMKKYTFPVKTNEGRKWIKFAKWDQVMGIWKNKLVHELNPREEIRFLNNVWNRLLNSGDTLKYYIFNSKKQDPHRKFK
jgi:hypothetical protein